MNKDSWCHSVQFKASHMLIISFMITLIAHFVSDYHNGKGMFHFAPVRASSVFALEEVWGDVIKNLDFPQDLELLHTVVTDWDHSETDDGKISHTVEFQLHSQPTFKAEIVCEESVCKLKSVNHA